MTDLELDEIKKKVAEGVNEILQKPKQPSNHKQTIPCSISYESLGENAYEAIVDIGGTRYNRVHNRPKPEIVEIPLPDDWTEEMVKEIQDALFKALLERELSSEALDAPVP